MTLNHLLRSIEFPYAREPLENVICLVYTYKLEDDKVLYICLALKAD